MNVWDKMMAPVPPNDGSSSRERSLMEGLYAEQAVARYAILRDLKENDIVVFEVDQALPKRNLDILHDNLEHWRRKIGCKAYFMVLPHGMKVAHIQKGDWDDHVLRTQETEGGDRE